MSGFTYLINLKMLGDTAIGKLNTSLERTETAVDKVNNSTRRMGRGFQSAGNQGRTAFDGMSGSLSRLAIQVGSTAALLGSLNTAADSQGMENAIRFSGAADGVANLEFVKDTVKSLKMPLLESLDGFKTLSGGMMGTGVTAAQTQDIFKSVGEGALVMGLNADQTKGAFLALSQMASKGTVSAEELRGQLGERLPGAFNIAARAMGVTTGTLGKMLEQGEVVSADFLPKFAKELHKTFGPGVQAALDSPRAKFNEMGNAAYRLKTIIGTELMPAATLIITDYLIPAAEWMGKNIDLVGGLATVFGSLYIAAKATTTIMAIQALVTGGLTGTVWGLNAALLANPIVLIVAGIIALGAATVYAWNRFEWFRAGVYGVWEVIKPFASFLANGFTLHIRASGLAMKWAWDNTDKLRQSLSWLWDKIKEGADWIWDNIIKPFTQVGQLFTIVSKLWNKHGQSIGNTFTDGWNKGVADFGKVGGPATNAAINAPVMTAFDSVAFGQPPCADSKTANEKSASMANGIIGGGQKNITMNINKLVEQLTIQTTTVREGAEQIRDIVIKELDRKSVV